MARLRSAVVGCPESREPGRFHAGGTWEEVDEVEQKVPGARVLDREGPEECAEKGFWVYAGPAGRPFCLCRIEQP